MLKLFYFTCLLALLVINAMYIGCSAQNGYRAALRGNVVLLVYTIFTTVDLWFYSNDIIEIPDFSVPISCPVLIVKYDL